MKEVNTRPPTSVASRDVGEVLAECLRKRDLSKAHWGLVSKHAGLDDGRIRGIIEPRSGKAPNVRRGTLLKISAALDLDEVERTELTRAAGEEDGWLADTSAEGLQKATISMRRAVLLLAGPTDPHRLHFHRRLNGVATRSGVVFGWHDVVVRLTTPEGVSALDYTDDLFQASSLRTIETILLRDDLPIYVDQDFVADNSLVSDYRWAVIFVQALDDCKKPEFRDIFREVASRPEFKGSIHLLTAAVAVGQFDSVIEVLASNVSRLKSFVRTAQAHGRESEREAHTVTYISEDWRQRSADHRF